MNTPAPNVEPKCVHLSLCVFTGAIVATAVVILLASENVGAMHLAYWQMAAIYIALIAASVRLGRNDCTKNS